MGVWRLGGAAIAFAAVLLTSCGPDGSQDAAGTVQVAAPAVASGTPAPPSNQSALVTTSAPAPYDAIKAAVDSSALPNVALIFGNASGEIYRYKKGNIQYTQQYDIASSSKWLTAMLAVRMIQAGVIQFSDRPQHYLSYWTSSASDKRSSITLAQLLAFQSGFNATPLMNGCVDSGLYTLQSCAQRIYNGGTDSDPGYAFSYGPEHLQIAGAMIEKAGNSSFNTLFASHVTTPLGLTATNFPKASASNPWTAGGGQSSANDFAILLRALLSGSFISDLNTFLSATSRNLPGGKLYVPDIGSDIDEWEFANGSWVECDPGTGGANFATQCAANKINSAPGAFGWVPWIDRKNGYWAVIAAENHLNGAGKAVSLEQQLQPLIVAALQN